jgi:hypothetical protein
VIEIAKPSTGSVMEMSEFGSTAIQIEIIAVAINERMNAKLYQELVSRVFSPSMKRIRVTLLLFESPTSVVGLPLNHILCELT